MKARPLSLAGAAALLAALCAETAAADPALPALMEIAATPNTPGAWSGFVIRYSDLDGDRLFDFNELSFFSGASLLHPWGATSNFTGIRYVPSVAEVADCGGWFPSNCSQWGFWYWLPPRYTIGESVSPDFFTYVVSEVPENGTLAMVLVGLAGVALAGRAATPRRD